jgi:CRP/FNR family transcriptional regulator, cyclic AMP receptor protein
MSESVEIAAAQRSGLLRDLDPPDIEGILAAGQTVTFEPEQAIFESGDVGDAMYVITEGEARVDVGGRFHILKAGEFFGEMALIAPGRRMATVKAVTPVTALRIPAEAFQSFLLAHPNVALAMMKTLVVRLREVEQRLDAWMA